MYRPTLSVLQVCIFLMHLSLFLAGTALLVLAATVRRPRTTQPTMTTMEGVPFGSSHLAMETSPHLRVLGLTVRILS